MSALALKETAIAVRIGLVVASWGRCHECLENMLKCEPDCKMDFEQGRQIWSSMKVMLSFCKKADKNEDAGETTSGGWEFLVDCNRDEATAILRKRKPGSFLLRPHPEDHGVFTISFNTASEDEKLDVKRNRIIKTNDAVQHAIVRLSDVGFRCGSFGPFSSLLKLLEAVSSSLPFDLRFSDPPVQGIIKEEGGQPSPNTVFIRKLALHSKTEHYRWNSSTKIIESYDGFSTFDDNKKLQLVPDEFIPGKIGRNTETELQIQLGIFSQLLTLTELRKQFCAVVAGGDKKTTEASSWDECDTSDGDHLLNGQGKLSEHYFEGSLAESYEDIGEEEMEAISSRTIRPFLNWCRALETSIVHQILPLLSEITRRQTTSISPPVAINQALPSGDATIRRMIQPKSGVEFRTLRVGEGGHTAVVVLFSRSEAISWMISCRAEKDEVDAAQRLDILEKRRVIEQIDLNDPSVVGKGNAVSVSIDENNEIDVPLEEIRYRFVDPWEVEVLESKDFELRATSLGREHYVSFTIGAVARACEYSQRSLGGLHLLALWSAAKGGVCLTKALASAHPPWERDQGGDLPVANGLVSQCSTYESSLRQHLYRNALFRRLGLPQRFLAFIQVELLDLKNLTHPGSSPSITAYALLRLKRTMSNAPLTHKARTLDSACTEQRKISKSSGPNAPASWGSLVRFRFPLPEDVNCDGVSYDSDREALFKGAPCVLQISVYEKKFMNDLALGGADIKLDALSDGGQLEEWVPLRSQKSGVTWFARIRLTLRFELMCLEPKSASKESLEDQCPSAGLRKIHLLSRIGGVHEDSKGVQRSVSTPDFVGLLGNIAS